MSDDKKKQTTENLEKQKEKWIEEFGEVYEIAAEADIDEGNAKPMVFYFKKPGRTNLSRYIKDAMKNAYKAMYNLTFDCLLYPDRDAVTKLIEEKPGLIIALGNELQEIIGVNQDFFSKKL
ncbi:MAG: hypothetical protein PWR10_1538 [Halanaerobiales bacterium]|nr:hypothetical protein [Halanaerobiales bacterium]